MAPPSKAKWTFGRVTPGAPDANGTVTMSAELLDTGQKQGTVFFSMTSDRALRVEFQAEKGVAPLTDFQAWIRRV
jgi:hypothetical protein